MTALPLEKTGRSSLWRDAAVIALAATLVRICIALLSSARAHQPVWLYAYWGDGPSYVAQARAMCGDASTLTDFDRRVFPGFAALIAIVHTLTHATFEYAALIIPWICSGIAAGAGTLLFRDRRIGWAMAFLIPHYLTYSSMPMSEAPLLAFMMCGMLIAQRGCVPSSILGGVLLGCAGMIRPVAAFAVIGFFAYDVYRRRVAVGFVFGIAAAVTLGFLVALHQHWSGDALHGVHVYATNKAAYGDDKMFTWPFHSLLATPHRPDLPDLKKGKIAYIWIHVVLVLIGCGLIVRQAIVSTKSRGGEASLDLLCVPWLLLNTLFVLCVGSKWGFFAFPRFTIPAMPAAFWAYRRILPKRWWVWGLILAASLVIAIDSVKRMN